MPNHDQKLSSPSALRNREPILKLLRDVLPENGTILEIASGSGEHIVHFAAQLQGLTWQPSDPSEDARTSILAWSQAQQNRNLLPPLDIDTRNDVWPIEYADAIIAINMVHISPWSATLGLFKGANQLLSSGGKLILYGPYRQDGQRFVQSNADFDASLQSRNPEWGIRQLEDVVKVGKRCDLHLKDVITMPANNLTVVFERG